MNISLISTTIKGLNKPKTHELFEKAIRYWNSLSFGDKVRQGKKYGKRYFKFKNSLFYRDK